MRKFSYSPSSLLPFTKRGVSCPKKLKADKVLSLDWLEFSLIKTNFLLDVKSMYWTITENTNLRSNRFRNVYEVRPALKEDVFCILQVTPNVSFIPADTVICKVGNRYLYDKNLYSELENFFQIFGLQINKINRIDVALDFQFLKGGKSVQNFMKKCATLDYKKKSQRNFKPLFQGNDKKKWNEKTKESGNFAPRWRGKKVSSLTYGSRSSTIYTTMYNKTQEMTSRKFKPWVWDSWKAVGFDEDLETYRLEFSIKPSKKGVINTEDGDIIGFNSLRFVERSNQEILFRTILDDRFRFAVNDGKKFERSKPVEVFEFDKKQAVHVLHDVSDKTESSNHTKYYIKRIYNRILAFSVSDRYDMYQMEYYLTDVVEQHCLQHWFARKFPDYQLKNPPTLSGQQIIDFENLN